jgi:pimeloyl-ACP methyl ester carboxylesterase
VTRSRLVPLALVLAVVATACSDDPEPPTTAPSSASPSASPSTTSPAPTATATASGTPKPAALTPWKGCADDGFQCSTLQVPLDVADPGKGTVTLALTRKRATRSGDRIGSLIINPGGPGSSAVNYLQAVWQGIPAPVRARFDLVAFDPRGVGRSAPVRCGTTAELDTYFHLDPTPDTAAELKAYTDGNTKLAKGCQSRSGRVLPHVSTREAADDLDRVRAAVGDEKLTYLGYSYGTAIGATYLERHPTKVRAMVLDGALDPRLTWDKLLEGQSKGFDLALNAFMNDCERTRCSWRREVSGDLLEAFDALAARIDRQALPGSGGRTVGPGEFSLGAGYGMYSKNLWPTLSSALVQAQRGKGAEILEMNDRYLDRSDSGYQNTIEANLAVNCIDKPWPSETSEYVALAERVRKDAPRFGPAIALSGLSCAPWPVGEVMGPRTVRGTGAPPVVVIGTTRDPATPYEWSVALAEQLDKGVLLINEGDGHTVYRVGAPDCIRDRVDSYLLTGKAPSPARC